MPDCFMQVVLPWVAQGVGERLGVGWGVPGFSFFFWLEVEEARPLVLVKPAPSPPPPTLCPDVILGARVQAPADLNTYYYVLLV
jgi:hypothetical protein